MTATSKLAPPWIEAMSPHRWYAISGDHPDLHLPATASGTRYLIDTDPARDPALNPARTREERLRRMLGSEPKSPRHGAVGFSAITEAWNGAAYASRYGASGSMIIFGGGHNDYFGSDVHAFDLASKPVLRPYAAMEHTPNLARLVYFSALDNGVLYTVEGPHRRVDKFVAAWTWHAHEPAADTLRPIADAGSRSHFPSSLSHTFGRFHIASFGAIDLALVVRHVDSPVYALRLT